MPAMTIVCLFFGSLTICAAVHLLLKLSTALDREKGVQAEPPPSRVSLKQPLAHYGAA